MMCILPRRYRSCRDMAWLTLRTNGESVAQQQVRGGDAQGDDRDQCAVLRELPEGDWMAAALRDPDHHHVGARADRGGVAAEISAENERPPQTVLAPEWAVPADKLVDHGGHGGDKRDVVDDR